MRAAILAGATGVLGLSVSAHAQESTYTSLNEETCRTLSVSEEGSATRVGLACEGLDGWTVYREADDHGEWAGFSQGDVMPDQLPYGGYLGNFGHFHSVIEWRSDTDGTAFATIHRYYSTVFDTGETESVSVLIVTGLRPGADPEACHVGYVVASEVEDANTQARLMADEMAPHIACDDHRPFRIDAEIPSVIQLISLQH